MEKYQLKILNLCSLVLLFFFISCEEEYKSTIFPNENNGIITRSATDNTQQLVTYAQQQYESYFSKFLDKYTILSTPLWDISYVIEESDTITSIVIPIPINQLSNLKEIYAGLFVTYKKNKIRLVIQIFNPLVTTKSDLNNPTLNILYTGDPPPITKSSAYQLKMYRIDGGDGGGSDDRGWDIDGGTFPDIIVTPKNPLPHSDPFWCDPFDGFGTPEWIDPWYNWGIEHGDPTIKQWQFGGGGGPGGTGGNNPGGNPGAQTDKGQETFNKMFPKENTLTEEQRNKVIEELNKMLNDCVYESINNYILENYGEFSGKVCIRPIPGSASITTQGDLVFGSPYEITATNMKHEWIHMYQRTVTSSLKNPTAEVAGMMEFEVALFQDLIFYVRNGGQLYGHDEKGQVVISSWSLNMKDIEPREKKKMVRKYMRFLGQLCSKKTLPSQISNDDFNKWAREFGKYSKYKDLTMNDIPYKWDNTQYGTQKINNLLKLVGGCVTWK